VLGLFKGDPVQTTLLGLAIAFIIALVAALIGPYFVDWSRFRPQFEAEASTIIGAPVRVAGALDARLLPTPTLRLRSVTIGGSNEFGKARADKLDVEFSLGDLMRGQWRANELTINGLALDLGLDPNGRIDLPASTGKFNLGSLSIDRLNLTGHIALHEAASGRTLEFNDVAFSGDVRSLAGAIRGDGNFSFSGVRYPFRVSSGQTADGNGTRVHLNIDSRERALAAELDGVLAFEARVPRFEGTLLVSGPTSKQGAQASPPWRISARVKADPSAAKLDQLETSYGPEESALKASGSAEIRFGASPLLHAVLAARQLDADRLAAKDANTEPLRLLPALRGFMAAIPPATIPTQIEFSAEQIMLGGRPLQNLTAELDADNSSWIIHQLDVRAPGSTHVTLSGAAVRPGQSDEFKGKLDIDSSDPDAMVAWMQGRGDISYRSQRPLRLSGDVDASRDRVSIEALKLEIEGGALEGRATFSRRSANRGAILQAELKGDRLDLDAATNFIRSVAGPQDDWPDEATLSLDLGRAISSGHELRPFAAQLAYTPKTISLEQLKFGEANGVTVEGEGNFDRSDAVGRLELISTAPSLSQLTAGVTVFAPSIAARVTGLESGQGPARARLVLDLGKYKAPANRTFAQAIIEFEAPQLRGFTTITSRPETAALLGFDRNKLADSEFSIDARLSSERAGGLISLLGLDRAIAVGDGPAQFDGSLAGTWRAPLRLNVKLSGAGLDADAQGTAEPWTSEPKASVNLRIRRVNLAPLLGLKPSDPLAQNLSLSSRVSLAGNKLTFDDLESTAAASRLRGHLVLVLADEKSVEGEIGLDALELGPVFGLAIGAAGRDASDPLGPGLTKGWRGRVTFQALSGVLPGGAELRPVSGIIRGDGSSLTIDAIRAGIGGGEASGSLDARDSSNGLALNARLDFSGVDSSSLRYRNLGMPKGRSSLQMTLTTQGRSASALLGALSGNGTATLESAEIPGLDPRAFEVAIRASDTGQVMDDAKLRQIVEPVLSAGNLSVPSAQIPFTIRDGRLRIGATTLEAKNARAIVSGGYDIPADQADIRASLTSTSIGSASSRPEIQLFADGSPGAINRTVDVTSLSSWLAVRTIDRETRRLDSIERGEAPSSSTAALPTLPAGEPTAREQPVWAAPRTVLPKPRVPPQHPASGSQAPPGPPVASQQAPPLPPAIEVRPPPGSMKAKPRSPMMLVPPSNP
jgi:uncharacterized protein involved in outer membrane biogenesis